VRRRTPAPSVIGHPLAAGRMLAAPPVRSERN
jgi:hypothetical protein